MHIVLLCKVVDNYGDAGVCWRLARQLVAEHGAAVTLWMDDLHPLKKMHPSLDLSQSRQMAEGVLVHHWHEALDPPCDAGDALIEAFACGTPEPLVADLIQRRRQHDRQPVWINLEYLSAEPWVDDCHLTQSVQPSSGLVQTFFFPGFSLRTGGLLREQNALHVDPCDAPEDEIRLSLFCYPVAPVAELIDGLQATGQRVRVFVPEGLPALKMGAGDVHTHGRVTIEGVPFLSQDGYDDLLRSCDLNFVRGEDSFVRGMWAQKPLIWNIYPQAEHAHFKKLDAFQARYLEKMNKKDAETLALMGQMWNLAARDTLSPWPSLMTQLLDRLPAYTAHAQAWAAELAKMDDLATQLMRFIKERVSL